MTPEMMLAKMLSTPQSSVEKTASAEEVESKAMEKLAWADEFGKQLAREHMEKVAVLPGMVTKGLGHAMGALTTSSGVKRGLIGAGVGAAAGAVKDPGVDPATGQKKSRLANMAVGAGLGAGAGVAAGHLARSAGSMNNVVGKTLGGAQTAVAKQTGNIAAMQQGTAMAQARGAAQRTSTARAIKPVAPTSGAAPAAPSPQMPNPATQPSMGKTLDQVRQGR